MASELQTHAEAAKVTAVAGVATKMDAVADHFFRCIAVSRTAVAVVNHLKEENPSDAVPRINVGVIITRLLWNRRG